MRRLLLIGAACVCLVLSAVVVRSVDEPVTRAARDYAAATATHAAATYVTLRTLYAVLSTAQEFEVGMSLIASGSAHPLKVLEPIDDTIERIATLVFGVMVATGILSVALGPVSAVGLGILALGLGIAALSPQRPAIGRLAWYGGFFGLALPLGLALATPMAGFLTEATYVRNLALVNEITQTVGGAEATLAEEAPDLSLNDYRKIAVNVWTRADELIGGLVAIFGVYVFRIFMLPLLLIGGLFMAVRSLARGRATN